MQDTQNTAGRGPAMKHTPGPWTFSRSDDFGDARFYVAQQDGAPFTHNFSDVATLIAETVSSERVYIQEANARLIAAAPELLEALMACVEPADPGEDCPLPPALYNKVCAAIAKATGEA